MSGTNYLLDTNIILYLLAGDKTIARYLYQQVLYTSVITEIELLSFQKLSASEDRQVRKFLAETRVVLLDEAVKNEAIKLRRSYRLKLPDAIIAATAISLHLTLLTSDLGFRQIEELSLEIYEP